jgi:hypothetical protein
MSQLPNIERPLFACEVARRFELSDAARPLLREDVSPQQFFAELAKRELYPDAIKLAAHYLTPRETVWWGCLSLWQVIRERESPPDVAALDAVVRWVQTPTDDVRRAAKRAGEATKSTSIAGGLTRAAFFAGGSISLVGQPHVDPPTDLTAQIVAELALAAATQFVQPELKDACLRHFLQLAGEVSRGEAPWTNEKALAENSTAKSKELEHA